jgi:hypothetical protein
MMRSGVPTNTARCVAGRIVQAFPVPKLMDPTFGVNNLAVQARVRQITAGCM